MVVMSARGLAVLAAAALLTLVAWRGAGHVSAPSPPDNRPLEAVRDGYVSSSACRACHPSEYDSWHGSYHRRMTQVAAPGAVVGDFASVELSSGAYRYRLQRSADAFWVEIDKGDGSRSERFPVVLTTGSHHRQWYWYATGDRRRLAALPFLWLIDERRWIPREAAFMFAENADPHVIPSDHEGQWSASCVGCHTTHGEMRSVIGDDSKFVEFGIACEACHGPAEHHAQVNRSPGRRYGQWLAEDRDDSIVNPSRLSHRRSAEVCGQCHSVSLMAARSAHRADLLLARTAWRPGKDLTAVVAAIDRPEPFQTETRWADGRLRSGGREYDALTRTPCFTRGEMSCTSCHLMHRKPADPRSMAAWADDQLAPEMASDRACLQCHTTEGSEHTHHAADSSGSRCYNCHMPFTNYALLKAIRSHDVQAPTLDDDLEGGRPNACNLCHLDRSLGWTAEWLERWYGKSQPALTVEQQSVSASVATLLSGNAGQRGLIAWHMGWDAAREASGSDWLAPYLIQLLDDPYPAVRVIAWRSLRSLDEFAAIGYDPTGPRAQRTAAAALAFRTWESREVAPDPRPAVLLGPGGRLHRDAYTSLLARRDDRPITWLE